MQKKITINDVANRANVSKGAVSAVLSGNKNGINVSDATRKRIMDAVNDLNYRPSVIAKSLSYKKSFLLGLMCDANGGWGTSMQLIRGIQDVCSKKGYSLLVYPNHTEENELVNLKFAQERQVDAIIASPCFQNEKGNIAEYEKIEKSGIPVILLNNPIEGFISVMRNYQNIVGDAIEKLMSYGHKKIGFVTYSNYEDKILGPSSYKQFIAYESNMKDKNLESYVFPISFDVVGDNNSKYKTSVIEEASIFAEKYFNMDYKPTALIVSSNSLAYGMAIFLQKNNLKIPQDISIISLSNDYSLPEIFLPNFSCYPYNINSFCEKAVELCLNKSEKKCYHIPYIFCDNNTVKKL